MSERPRETLYPGRDAGHGLDPEPPKKAAPKKTQKTTADESATDEES